MEDFSTATFKQKSFDTLVFRSLTEELEQKKLNAAFLQKKR